jgi:predicted AAA+ superfamily ATPase
MILRTLGTQIQERLFGGKSIILSGPRQVGKTTLVRALSDALMLVLFGKITSFQNVLNKRSTPVLLRNPIFGALPINRKLTT